MAKYMTQSGETTIAGLASDSTPRHAQIDTVTHALEFVNYSHHEVHAGNHYYVTYPFTLAATSDSQEFILTTPNTTSWAHMVWDLSGSAITEVWVYEDSAVTSTDAISVFNNNRNSTNTADVALYRGSTSTVSSTDAAGTLIWHQKSGASSNQSRTSMQTGNDEELILKQNGNYRIRFETGTATNLCSLKLEWYEHTSKA